MKINISSTTKIVQVNGVPARIWEGQTESGISIHCFVTRIAVKSDQDTSQFEKELEEQQLPSAEVQSYPLRMIL
jgi:hypothetical protein